MLSPSASHTPQPNGQVDDSGFSRMELAIAIANLTGAILSTFGSGFIFLCYWKLPLGSHFRHRLIQNLTVSDFINASCFSISGIIKLASHRELQKGTACTINGLIGQITVQATDISILAIAITTVLTIRCRSFSTWTPRQAAFTIGSIWIIPLGTGITALGLRLYGPVSGNWCWIVPRPIYMRYVLTHSLRILIIFSVIILYWYLTVYLRRHFGRMKVMSNASSTLDSGRKPSFVEWRIRPRCIDVTTPDGGGGMEFEDDDEHDEAQLKMVGLNSSPLPVKQGQEQQNYGRITPSPVIADGTSQYNSIIDPAATGYRQCGNDPTQGLGEVCAIGDPNQQHQHPAASPAPPLTVVGVPSLSPTTYGRDPVRKIQKILLMRVYPTLYVIFWIPGIANRYLEACGKTNEVLQLCQASTQFIGLANAICYGWNENIPKLIGRYWKKKRSRKEDVGGV